jgi:hypothetical protein
MISGRTNKATTPNTNCGLAVQGRGVARPRLRPGGRTRAAMTGAGWSWHSLQATHAGGGREEEENNPKKELTRGSA